MQPIIDSLPREWEIVIWDNSGTITRSDGWAEVCTDLSVYGRYAAIEYASHDLIYVQDDDVIVSDPQAIVRQWFLESTRLPGIRQWEGVVCNMPPEFRPHYPDSGLVGFGAAFHRDAPKRAFDRFWERYTGATWDDIGGEGFYRRRADNVFTVLTPRVLVDVPKTDREMASDPNRMWKQPEHVGERDRMIDLARRVRDAA